jgi:hypothetical protein
VVDDLPVMMKLMRRGVGGFDLNWKLESPMGFASDDEVNETGRMWLRSKLETGIADGIC